MKKYLLAILGTFFLSTPVFAAGYGDAGCGLGSMLFGDQSGPIQILAATTNGTSYSQAFGITSGTSNCDASGIVLAEKEREIYAEQNYSDLSKEMATGSGEHLDTLAGLYGCPANTHKQFGEITQSNYKAIFTSSATTSVEMLNALDQTISSDPKLSLSCSS